MHAGDRLKICLGHLELQSSLNFDMEGAKDSVFGKKDFKGCLKNQDADVTSIVDKLAIRCTGESNLACTELLATLAKEFFPRVRHAVTYVVTRTTMWQLINCCTHTCMHVWVGHWHCLEVTRTRC